MSDAVMLLAAASIRTTGVLAAAWFITLLLRRSSASARHLVWIFAIGAVVLTPVLMQIPVWQVTIPEAFAQWSQSVDPRHTATEVRLVDATSVVANAVSDVTSRSKTTASAGPSLVTYLGATWFAGVVIVLLYVLTGVAATSRLRKSATRPTAVWINDARVLAEAMGVGHVAFAESAHARAPFVCGVVNPLVVMPPTVSDWDNARRRVAVLHELAHVKRRDCFTQLLAQIACALYWFHPLSWLAARRLRIEREHACDDAVLAAGVRGSEYAYHLVAVARHALPHPPLLTSAGVAMAQRSQLETRLRSILDPTTRRAAPRLARFGAMAFALLAFGLVSLRLQAQPPSQPQSPSAADKPSVVAQQSSTASSKVAFDVTSVKPNNTGSGSVQMSPTPNGGVSAENVTVGMLIRVANQTQDKLIIGGPKWIYEDHYNVVSNGTAPGGREGTFYEKLKTLLADRFKLVTHMEKREQPVFALVRARSDGRLGPKMMPSTADCSPSGPNGRGRNTAASPAPGADPRCGFNFGLGRILVGGQTPAAFAAALSLFAGDVVVDRTGLTGLYDFDLSFAPDGSVNSDVPSIFAAVQEQLGLKLEATRGQVDVLVIDSVEKPTPD